MVLGKLSVPGRPTYLDNSMVRAYCACSRCGWVLFGHFSLVYHFSFLTPSLWEMARYRLKYCLKGPKTTNQPTNQPYLHPFQKKKKKKIQTWILLGKKTLTLAIPPLPPLPPARFFFVRFGFLIKNSLSGLFVKENFTYPSRHPTPHPRKKYFTYASYFGYLFSLKLSMTSYYLEVTVVYISWSRYFTLYL